MAARPSGMSPARTRIKVECFVKWLKLKRSTEYLQAERTLTSLRQELAKAERSLETARANYFDGQNSLTELERDTAQKDYWDAEGYVEKAQTALSEEIEKVRERFDLVQWWSPEDTTVTVDNADCVVNSSLPIRVIPPPPGKHMDLNAEGMKEMLRTLDREGTAAEPRRRYTLADKDGWLTLKVNLATPLEELEQAIGRILRINRWDPPKGRHRPNKDAEALETWVCYEQEKQFSLVAKQLSRKVSTVKGQYVRAYVLLHGQKPSGSIKQRRAGTIGDPAGEFQAHLHSCSRCSKADSADALCPKYKSYVLQDTGALREAPLPM